MPRRAGTLTRGGPCGTAPCQPGTGSRSAEHSRQVRDRPGLIHNEAGSVASLGRVQSFRHYSYQMGEENELSPMSYHPQESGLNRTDKILTVTGENIHFYVPEGGKDFWCCSVFLVSIHYKGYVSFWLRQVVISEEQFLPITFLCCNMYLFVCFQTK